MISDETRYRFKGSYITYEELMTKVFEYLEDSPFQTHEFIATKVGAKPSIVENAIKDGIIRITKKYKEENGTDITFPYLCRTYGVRIEYIEELVREERIVVRNNGESLNDIKDLENEAIRKQKLENLKQLSGSLNTPSQTPRGNTNHACFHLYKGKK